MKLSLQNLPEADLNYRVYDLNDKILFEQGQVAKKMSLDLGQTNKDYFVLVTPQSG